MTKRKLRKLYDKKLKDEIDEFCNQMEQLQKEEIIACAYRIYVMHSIYEYLLGIQNELDKNKLKSMVLKENIITVMYWQWVKLDTYDNKELYECIEKTLKEISN